MERFGVVVHPLDLPQSAGRVYAGLARILPTPLFHLLTRRLPPLLLSEVRGVRSKATGASARGWLLGSPLTAAQTFHLPPQTVYDKAVEVGRLAQKHGTGILGLGGLTSAVGDRGVTIAQRLNMPVTTGGSLAVGFALEAVVRASQEGGPDMSEAVAAVVGASGTLGLALAEMLGPLVKRLILIGRREIRVSQARAQAEAAGGKDVRVSTEIGLLTEADIILTATSSPRPVLRPEHFKRGALVCDMAVPSDVGPCVSEQRPDVRIINGSIVQIPGNADLGFDLGLPPGHARAGMVEAMVLTLENRYESYSLGQRIDLDRVDEIMAIARRHGFRLARDPGLAPVEANRRAR